MAALADPTPNQRNGAPKAPAGAAAANGTAGDVETTGETTGGVSESAASNATPPASAATAATTTSTATAKKAAAPATNGKAAKKNLDPSEVRA
jgi:hypothetical protein